MPYSQDANYLHHRQVHPSKFDRNSFKTVPISHTKYKGTKYDKEGNMAVVGTLKSSGKWEIQSILEKK